MPRVTFDTMPATARLWTFAASRELSDAEASPLLEATDAFLDQWAAHGQPLTAARDWLHGRFLLVAVDEEKAGVSGCSVDALVRGLKELEKRLDVDLIDNGPITFRSPDGIRRVSRTEFSDLAASGAVTPDTVVFNNTAETVGDVRGGRWETRAADSWHGPAFFSVASG